MRQLLATPGLDALVRELDILIRARYPLIAISTFEEQRFCRVMHAVARLERHSPKGLFVWSRTRGLRQVAGLDPTADGKRPVMTERPVPDTEDQFAVLEHIAAAEQGLFVLCDFAPYLAPF